MLIVQDVEILAFNVLELEKHHFATALSLSYTLETVNLNIYIRIYIVQKTRRDRIVLVVSNSRISFAVWCTYMYVNIKRRVSDLPTYPHSYRSLECHRSSRGATYIRNIVLHREFLTDSIGK